MDKHELEDNILDQVIKYAAEQEVERIANQYTELELDEQITISPEFDKRMRLFLGRLKKQQRNAKIRSSMLRAGIAAVIILIISTSVIFTVDAIRVPLLNFINVMQHDSITINVVDEGINYDLYADQIHGLYLPSYLPDNYTVESIERSNNFYKVVFSNMDGVIINLWTLYSSSSVGVDSIDSNVKQIIINKEAAQYYKKDETNNLIFKCDKNAYFISSQLSEKEMVKIAESMKYRP